MNDDISLITKTQRAKAMRIMSDEDRNAAIAAASNVIDRRVMFGKMQQQRSLADAYRNPQGGGAA